MSVIIEFLGYAYYDITNMIPWVRRRRKERLIQEMRKWSGLTQECCDYIEQELRPGSVPKPLPWPPAPPRDDLHGTSPHN